MTNTKLLLDELDAHLRRYMEDRDAENPPGKNPHLFRMVITYEALRAQFNKRYAAMQKAVSKNAK